MVSEWWTLTTSIAAGVFIGKLGIEALNIGFGIFFQKRHEAKIKELTKNMPEGMAGFSFPLPASLDPSMLLTGLRSQPTTSGSTSTSSADDKQHGHYL